MWLSVRLVVLLSLASSVGIASAQKRYLEDFEFIRKTVQKDGAAVASKKIPWKAAAKAMRPRFAKCSSDVEHVKNVMQLLAVLRDSHTGITRTPVKSEEIPTKWDGLFGGGIWCGWDRGRVIVRGLMPGHGLEKTMPAGSILVEIDGWPAWLAMERERRRIGRYQGISSDHSLFASMGNRFLPFGEKRTLDVLALTPEGDFRKERIPKWGPKGQPFSMFDATVPAGVVRAPGAVSTMLTTRWSDRVGYLRITGSMNRQSVAAFHRAFDALKGMAGLVLDCRGMGGGGDGSAWEMAGRLYSKGVANGINGRIEASGSWQFDGPVVMLQDEMEVSSAETFTWAVSETGRVISVGRPTGGWGIIPKRYSCPSGLIDFRLGVTDRPTPIKRIHTEGTGWPPDVLIPYGPVAVARDDAAREVALAILEVLHAGAPVDATRNAFAGLFAGHLKKFRASMKKLARKVKKPAYPGIAKWVEKDIVATLAAEKLLLTSKKVDVPDVLGAQARLASLAARAKAAGLKAKADGVAKVLRRELAEAGAQRELLGILDHDLRATRAKTKAFLQRHGRTDTGRWVRKALFDG